MIERRPRTVDGVDLNWLLRTGKRGATVVWRREVPDRSHAANFSLADARKAARKIRGNRRTAAQMLEGVAHTYAKIMAPQIAAHRYRDTPPHSGWQLARSELTAHLMSRFRWEVVEEAIGVTLTQGVPIFEAIQEAIDDGRWLPADPMPQGLPRAFRDQWNDVERIRLEAWAEDMDLRGHRLPDEHVEAAAHAAREIALRERYELAEELREIGRQRWVRMQRKLDEWDDPPGSVCACAPSVPGAFAVVGAEGRCPRWIQQIEDAGPHHRTVSLRGSRWFVRQVVAHKDLWFAVLAPRAPRPADSDFEVRDRMYGLNDMLRDGIRVYGGGGDGSLVLEGVAFPPDVLTEAHLAGVPFELDRAYIVAELSINRDVEQPVKWSATLIPVEPNDGDDVLDGDDLLRPEEDRT